jgi:hemerythrin superfamily protein
MNAIDLLTEQHRALEKLMKATLESRESRSRSTAFAHVGDDLTKHLTSEENVFYPAIRSDDTEDILLESLEEHLSLKRLIADLLALEATAETWEAKFKVLKEQTEHHHKEEEQKLFPKVRNAMDAAALLALAEQIRASQDQLQRQGTPRAAVVDQTDEAAPLK